jgi:hypothetical protein
MTQILRVIEKPPMDSIDFSLEMQEKSRIRAVDVQELFRDADRAKRLAVPALADCEAIAQALTVFKCLGPPPKVGPVRYQKTKDGAKIPEHQLTPPRHYKAWEHILIAKKHLILALEGKSNKAEKYKRLARDYITKEIEAHNSQIAGRPLTNYHASLAAGMESIVRLDDPLESVGAIDRLIELWDEFPPPKWNWHGRALMVADMAQEAWRKAGRAPQDRGAEQPLSNFVKAALGATGTYLSDSSVSGALRERHSKLNHSSKQKCP